MTDTPPTVPAPRSFETRHEGSFNGRQLAYRCVAGETHLPDAKGEPRASIFAFSYLADDAGPAETRPVIFAFNG